MAFVFEMTKAAAVAFANLPEGFTDDDLAISTIVDGHLVVDPAIKLQQAKTTRVELIKTEAANLIKLLDWKLERAKEQEAAGWVNISEVDSVLAEREAIRRSSNEAEVAVGKLTDIESVKTFAWSVSEVVEIPRKVSANQFLDRFTSEEFQAVITATDSNTALRTWWERFKLTTNVNLDSETVISGVNALEMAGLLAAGRSTEILG